MGRSVDRGLYVISAPVIHRATSATLVVGPADQISAGLCAMVSVYATDSYIAYRPHALRVNLPMTDDINHRLLKRATQAFGDEAKARHWLTREQPCFQGASPEQYAVGPRRTATVMDHLTRIEHGIYPDR